MKLKFRYVKIGRFFRPIINIQLISVSNRVGLLALVDSGADFNVFHTRVADILQIDLKLCQEVEFKGVKDEKVGLKGRMAIVKLMVFDRGESIEFDTYSLFSDQVPPEGFALLGQRGFFNFFSEIVFQYPKKIIFAK